MLTVLPPPVTVVPEGPLPLAAGWLAGGAVVAVVGAAVVVVVEGDVVTVVVGAAVVDELEPAAPADPGARSSETAAARDTSAQDQRIRIRCFAAPMCGGSPSSAGSVPGQSRRRAGL